MTFWHEKCMKISLNLDKTYTICLNLRQFVPN